MAQLFRLSDTVERDPEIQVWLDRQPREMGSIARKWFLQMRACGDDVREVMHDGCPVVCVQDAPFGYVNIFTAHLNVGFFTGAMLQDPTGLLEGTGKRMRHVKLRPDKDVASDALSALIEAAYLDIKMRLAAGSGSPLLGRLDSGVDVRMHTPRRGGH